MGLSKYETETVIRFNDEDGSAIVYTCHRRVMTAMEKRGVMPAKEHKHNGRVFAREYLVPKEWIKINPPRKVSDKQREEMRRRIMSRIDSTVKKAASL